MLARINVIALNTYREAVRARVLHGLFGLAIATGGYSLVVGAYALRNHQRVVSDLGAASISIYGIIVAVVLGASSLYQELELKTIFPILTRPLRRWEYLVGKFVGTLLTLFVFITMNSGALLLALATLADRPLWAVVGTFAVLVLASLALGLRWPRIRVYVPIGLALLDRAADQQQRHRDRQGHARHHQDLQPQSHRTCSSSGYWRVAQWTTVA